MDSRTVSTGAPNRLRSFDPVRIARLEYRAWVGYYLRRWPQVLAASVGLVQAGFGLDPYSTLQGAWLVLRANQLWAPFPDNDPDGARACMQQFYELVKERYGEPADPAYAAALEVDEAWLGAAAEALHPATLTLLNLSRDQLDRVAEVRRLAERWRGERPGQHGGSDRLRPFRPRVVVGDHQQLGAAGGGGTHQWSLGGISITATAQYHQ